MRTLKITNHLPRLVVMEETGSSAIEAMVYNPANGRLGVRFTSGGEYTYEGIGLSTFENLVLAPSLGVAFNRLVRNRKRNFIHPRETALGRLIDSVQR